MSSRAVETLAAEGLRLLVDGGLLLVGLGAVVALAVGILLLVSPARASQLRAKADSTLSLRRALRVAEVPRRSERLIYRHHRVFGLLLMLAAVFFLYRFVVAFDTAEFVRLVSGEGRPVVAEMLVQALLVFFVISHLAILVLGLIVYLRPSLLKPVEQWANRWISSRRAMRAMEYSHHPVDRLVDRYPRTVGAAVALGSAYVLVSLLLAYGVRWFGAGN